MVDLLQKPEIGWEEDIRITLEEWQVTITKLTRPHICQSCCFTKTYQITLGLFFSWFFYQEDIHS
jgi:hypothetical protein